MLGFMISLVQRLIRQSLFTRTRAESEFFFADLDAKLSKVAPEGWKEDPKKKKSDVPFNLFLRIKFFLEDVSLIQ